MPKFHEFVTVNNDLISINLNEIVLFKETTDYTYPVVNIALKNGHWWEVKEKYSNIKILMVEINEPPTR